MAKFTKSEDTNVPQSLRYTDGVPGNPPNKLEDGTYQQFGTGSNLLQVFRPYQGFDLLYKNPNMNQGSTEITQDLDARFKLGTYTLNDRGSWEDNNFNESTLGPYLTEEFEGNKSYKLKTRRTTVVDTADGPITLIPAQGQVGGNVTPIGPYEEHNTGIYSIETLPFVINPTDDEIIRLDRYYDKEIHKEQYELATEGKINLKIVLSFPGRVPTKNNNSEYIYTNSDGVQTDYLPTVNFGQNIDIFSNRPARNNGDYADALIIGEDNAGTENGGAYIFKLNWGDGTVLEHTDDPLLLESTTLLEHFYDKPGFYSITGLVYRVYRGHIMHWERFQTNILLNPSPLYDTKLFDFSNFASIGGVSKNSAFVKSLYNLTGINPLPPYNNDRADINNLIEFNILDVINLLNVLGKVDYSLIQPYYDLLSPYQTPTDDVDSFVFGCTSPDAANYNEDANIDDGSCIFVHDVTLLIAGEPPIPIILQIGETNVNAGQVEPEPEFPPAGITVMNPMIGTLSPLGQWVWNLEWEFLGPEVDDNTITVARGMNEFKMITNQGDSDEGGLGYYDYVFLGWYNENNDLITTDVNGVANVNVLADRVLTAKFQYQDTTPPGPVEDLEIYNHEQFFQANRPEQTTLPLDSITVFFDDPNLAEGTFEYNDIDYFKINRFYYDYILDEQIEEEITQIPFGTEKELVRFPSNLLFNRYKYIDENLPYREYIYQLQTVDLSGLVSDLRTTSPLYPTPNDTTPQAISNESLSLIQNRPKRLIFSWQQISEAWPGLEGNFKHFKIEVDGPNADDYVYEYNDDYIAETSGSLIPTLFEQYYQNGLVQKQFNDVGGTSETGFYTPSGDAMTLEWTTILPWRFKISVVGDTSQNDESPATEYIEVIPENYIGADMNIIGTANTFQQIGSLDGFGINTEQTSVLQIPFNIQNFITEFAQNAFAGNGVDPNHPNGFLQEDKNGLYIRVFTKDLINNDNTIPGYNPTYIGEPFNISYNNTVREYPEFERFIGSPSVIQSLSGKRLYVGLFDSNDNNLVAETSDFVQINDINGCMDTNADNYMSMANINYNCTYSYKIITQTEHTFLFNLAGGIYAYECVFGENEAGNGYVDNIGFWRDGGNKNLSIIRTGTAESQYLDSEPTINYNDIFETVGNQYFLVLRVSNQNTSVNPDQTVFNQWIIDNNQGGLEFAEVTNIDDDRLTLGNWTNDITSLNEVTQQNLIDNSNGSAHIAVKASEFAGPENYQNKIIKAEWFDGSGGSGDSDVVSHVDIRLVNMPIQQGAASKVRFMESGNQFVSSIDNPSYNQKSTVGVNTLFSIQADTVNGVDEWQGWYFDSIFEELAFSEKEVQSLFASNLSEYWQEGTNRPILKLYAKVESGV